MKKLPTVGGGPGGGGEHSTSQLDRGVPLGGGSKPDPVILRSAQEKYTLSYYTLLKNIQMHTLLQYCTPRIYPV